MPPTLKELEILARQAGEILREGFSQARRVYYKGVIDLVTDVDRQSEDFLLSEIQRRFPQDAIVAEESGGKSGQDCCRWFIDPLDGTVNFAHGVPIFAVSIAYEQDSSLRFGVVYDPMMDECFYAERGQGAYLNGEAIHPSDVQKLDHSLLVTGFPYDIRTNPDNNLDLFNHFALISQGVRRLGSAALDLCYVACGRFDGFWEKRLSAWDIAAGALIAREAGALVTDLSGGGDYLAPPFSIIAASSDIHHPMLTVINEGR